MFEPLGFSSFGHVLTRQVHIQIKFIVTED